MTKFILLLLLSLSLHAHQMRENYLHISYDEHLKTFKMVLEVESRLLENEKIVDDNHNGIVSYKELKAHKNYLLSYVKQHFQLYSHKKKLSLAGASVLFHRYQSQTYMSITKTFTNINLDTLQLKYSMFFELEKNHKLLIHLDDNRGDYILNNSNRIYNFSSFKTSPYERLKIFVQNGIFHILDGRDHLLFILMILIPSIVLLSQKSQTLKSSLINILKIVTTFSLAHSITLFISGIGFYKPSIPFIESGIALSIFIVAFMNFIQRYNHVNKKIVFLFGLLHGFGFANVLEIAKIDSTMEFLTALFGFNLGVEIGQIFVILLILPFLYLLSQSRYCISTLKLLSLLAMLISAYWFFQRVRLL